MVTRHLHRRGLLGAGAATLLAPAVLRAAAPIEVTDLFGRTVRLARPPRRIVLLEARDILTMALLHPDPAKLVVGWAAADRIDSSELQVAYEQAAGRPIAVVGRQSSDTISLEGLVALEPDLVVATAFMQVGADPAASAERLAVFGIPVLFGSSASNETAPGGRRATSPIEELPALLRMWGTILGRPDRSEALIAFTAARQARLARCLSGAAPVKTYLEIMSLYDECCWSAGQRIWGELLVAAGGRPLDGVSAAWTAQLGIEQLIAEEPRAYIATGGGYASGRRLAVGPHLDLAAARDGLRRLTRRTGFDTMPAVREGRVHGIWSGLIASTPLNLLFLEIAARWLHPDRCAEIDPGATLAALNQHFLAYPLPGPLWASLDETMP